MRCSGCEYLYYPEPETNYTSCLIFGDDTPDEDMRADGEGCKYNGRQLAKMFKEHEEAWLNEAKAFCDWYEKEKEREKNCGEDSN